MKQKGNRKAGFLENYLQYKELHYSAEYTSRGNFIMGTAIDEPQRRAIRTMTPAATPRTARITPLPVK